MEEILLSDKIKDYKIDFAERDADFIWIDFTTIHITRFIFCFPETAVH